VIVAFSRSNVQASSGMYDVMHFIRIFSHFHYVTISILSSRTSAPAPARSKCEESNSPYSIHTTVGHSEISGTTAPHGPTSPAFLEDTSYYSPVSRRAPDEALMQARVRWASVPL
jgi:hypothetical protein